MRRVFDRYMIAVGAGRHPKLRDLTVKQRYVFFQGVLSIAAESPRRGFLMVGERQADGRDIAAACDVDGRLAARTLDRCRALGLIETDPGTGNEFVHDWWDYNPDPRVDATNAERQRRYRERQRNASRNASSVTSRNAGEVEVEVEKKEPPLPPLRASRGRVRAVGAPNGNTGTEWDGNRSLSEREGELCSMFSEYPPWRVLRAVHALSSPGAPATVDAIRAYLNRSP